MTINHQNILKSKPKWLSSALLLMLLYFMYSPTFLSDYLMNDERGLIGRDAGDFASVISSYFFRYGRGLFGLYEKLVYEFVGYDTARIQFIRFINFASIAIIAVLLLRFLERRMKNKYFAFFTILFFLSQLSFQGLMGYSLQLFSNSQPSIWLSLLAFYLFFFVFDGNRISNFIQMGIVFIVLMLAMQSTQTYAFFGLIPVAYLALSDWRNSKRKILTFLLIAFIVFIVSTIAYQAGLNILSSGGDQEAYVRGERGLNELYENPIEMILFAINPRTYWSVFKFWTFPFPVHNIPPLLNIVEKVLSLSFMVLWFGIIFSSIVVECKRAGRNESLAILSKWLTVLFCFGLSAVFIVANSPLEIIDHRPHILLTFSGLVVFTGAYALEVLERKIIALQRVSIRVLMSLTVLLSAFGAQAGVLRNIVNIHTKQIDFIRSELMAKDPDSYESVIIILPKWNKCISEPCGPWFGYSTDANWHLTRAGAYRYVLATIGADPMEKEITHVYYNLSTDLPPDAVVVDWNTYSKAQQRYADYFKSKWLGSTFPFLFGE